MSDPTQDYAEKACRELAQVVLKTLGRRSDDALEFAHMAFASATKRPAQPIGLSVGRRSQAVELGESIRGWVNDLREGEKPEVVADLISIAIAKDFDARLLEGPMRHLALGTRGGDDDEWSFSGYLSLAGSEEPVEVEMHRVVEVPLVLRLLVPASKRVVLKNALKALRRVITQNEGPLLEAIAEHPDVAAILSNMPDPVEIEPHFPDPDTVLEVPRDESNAWPPREDVMRMIQEKLDMPRPTLRWVAYSKEHGDGYWEATVPMFFRSRRVKEARFIVRSTKRPGYGPSTVVEPG